MSHMTARLLSVCALIIALFVAPAHAAHASSGDYPPGGCVITVTPPQPAPGETFTVTAVVEQPGQPPEQITESVDDEITAVTFTFNGQTYVEPVVNGVATLTLTAPTAPGNYSGTAECGTQVVDWDVSVPTSTVPPTGTDTTRPATAVGAAMLALGGLMVIVAKRRRSDDEEPALV